MYYISNKKDNTWGVTCTETNTVAYFTERELVDLVEKKKLKIYGLDTFNHEAKCTKLRPLTQGSSEELRKRLNKWKEVHNQWNGYPVENYLAMLPINTVVRIDYTTYSEEQHIRLSGSTTILKLDDNTWKYNDSNNTQSGRVGDHEFAAWCLEVAYIYCARVDCVYVS